MRGTDDTTRMTRQFDHTRKDWPSRTSVVIASGPSLTAEDCEMVRQAREADLVRVVSVSNAWKHCAKWADAFFAADRRYWKHYLSPMLKAGVPRERLVTCCTQTYGLDKIALIRAANRPGLGTYQLHTGGNSGYMGVNLAYLYGARRIVLLGFDCCNGPDGAKHFDGSHPSPLVQAMPFGEWIKRFDKLALELKAHGAAVINCSRRTALTCFERAGLAESLPRAKEPA
jgi:hypothetical protein